MKTWIKFIIILLVCVLVIGSVYVWRFGWPKWENKDEKLLQNIFDSITSNNSKESNIIASLNKNNIVFSKTENNEETIEFTFDNGIMVSSVKEKETDMDFYKDTISMVFEAVAVYNGYDAINARYSLTEDILVNKKLGEDGYQYTSLNNVARFMVTTKKKLNLANKEEVYIKESDLQGIEDVITNKLQYRLIEKVGIALEKNVSYSRNLVFVIYEQEMLSSRTYNSLLTLIKMVTGNSKLVEYVSSNYPIITRAGTLTLDGISISLNEGLGEGNVYYYEKPDDYEYMLIKINIDKYIGK